MGRLVTTSKVSCFPFCSLMRLAASSRVGKKWTRYSMLLRVATHTILSSVSKVCFRSAIICSIGISCMSPSVVGRSITFEKYGAGMWERRYSLVTMICFDSSMSSFASFWVSSPDWKMSSSKSQMSWERLAKRRKSQRWSGEDKRGNTSRCTISTSGWRKSSESRAQSVEKNMSK